MTCVCTDPQEERIIFISTVLSRPETLPPLAATPQQQQQQQGRQDDVHLGFWQVQCQSNHPHAMVAAKF
jgi:invasion protein IalB